MPLAGGPSDKAGNRYELLWTTKCLTDVYTKQAQSIYLEPPNENGIEFRLSFNSHSEVHQVKRGYAKESRWRLKSLEIVLGNFGEYLKADPQTVCVFVSGHSAHIVSELSERAYSSNSFNEFNSKFLTTSIQINTFQELSDLWKVEPSSCWEFLRRVKFVTISEEQLRQDLDKFLEAIFTVKGTIVRSVLSQYALENIHKILSSQKISKYLATCDIQSNNLSVNNAEDFLLSPPIPYELFGRDEILSKIKSVLDKNNTLAIGGPPGIGKSAIAASICHGWKVDSKIWIDCKSIKSVQDVLFLLNSFASLRLSDQMLVQLSSKPDINVSIVGRMVGAFANKHRALIVWDNYQPNSKIKELIENIGQQINRGRQIITEREHSGWLIPRLSFEKIPPFNWNRKSHHLDGK